MRRHHVVCLAFVVSAGVIVSAQTWPVIPPIPLQERFRVRTDLAVTLKLNASQLLAGEQPIFTLKLHNTGSSTLRVPPYVSADLNVRLRVFDASGSELRSPISCIFDGYRFASVRSYWRLGPGQARDLSLGHKCGGLPPLPPGVYQFEATYRNYPGSPGDYDVYERDGAEAWDGRITTPRVALKVLPLDADTERSLIARVDAARPPDAVDDAIQGLGLGGTAPAIAALIRWFDRDPSRRLAIAWTIIHSPDPGSAAALREAFARLPAHERELLASRLGLLKGAAILQPEKPPDEQPFSQEVRPDPAARPEYVEQLIAGIDNERGRELALKGVARFGTVDDFSRLKGAFATRDEESRSLVLDALTAMTFISDRDAYPSRQLAYWDDWWTQHAGQTRVQWAREALVREPLKSDMVNHDVAPSRAAGFLLANQGLSPALVRELSQHRSWLVRLALADDVARADERSGGRLFIRELSNRYIGACAAANERLELLVRRRYHFDCTDPKQRQQAIAHWTTVIDSMEPGFLPLTVSKSAR